MSRPWKSELRLALSRRHCRGWLPRGLFGSRAGTVAQADGRAADSLPAVVARLRAAEAGAGRRWSVDAARLTVADECVYYAILPADAPWSRREGLAHDHFAATIGAQDLAVRVSLLPGGRHWLAVAVEQAQLTAWHDALRGEGLRLARIRPALPDDLARIARRVPDDGVLAVLRDEGAMLLQVERGAPRTLSWERFDTADAGLLVRRVQAFARRGAHGDSVAIALPDAAARPDLAEHAHALGWAVHRLASEPPPAGPAA